MDSIVYNKTFSFVLELLPLCRNLNEIHNLYDISKQLLRCSTSIGANIKEALYAQSKKDFTYKMSIASKEASETEYWLELLLHAKYINNETADILLSQCREIMKMLTSIRLTTTQRYEIT